MAGSHFFEPLSGGKYLITNFIGKHNILTKKQYNDFLSGDIIKDKKLYADLTKKGFIRNNMDFERLIDDTRKRYSYLFCGPSLHILVITLRCNHRCVYCHAGSPGVEGGESVDMSKKTAQKAIDFIFKANTPSITIEFQGGEPLLNWETLSFAIAYARKKERELKKKKLTLALVSNLSLLDRKKLTYLIKHRVDICTSLDGPKPLHDGNRVYLGGSSYDVVTQKAARIKREYKKISSRREGRDVQALMTTTKRSLPYATKIVDEYVRQGFEWISLRPLNTFMLPKQTIGDIGYGWEEYVHFYKKAMDHIIALNMRGVHLKERTAWTILKKILFHEDPNYLEMRSPCGAAIGQLAYNYNGDIYTCDEGRMLARNGDNSFKLGNIQSASYKKIMNCEITKSACLASWLDGIPGCNDCAFQPYCGTCPVANWSSYGTLFPPMITTNNCKVQKELFRYFFEKMQNKRVKKLFLGWIK